MTSEQQVPEWADPAVPEEAAGRAGGVPAEPDSRGAGLLGAGFAAAGVAAAAGAAAATTGTAYGVARVIRRGCWCGWSGITMCTAGTATTRSTTSRQLAQRGAQFGLDWMAFTEHSNFGHADKGAQAENAEVVKARAENPRMLIFQGLEWYIPAAEHGTVLVAPGPNNVALLQQFEREYDGKLTNRSADTAGERAARGQGAAVARRSRSRAGTSTTSWCSPTTRSGWASTHRTSCGPGVTRGVCIGMEGAPGSQGDADPAWVAYRGQHQRTARGVRERPRHRQLPGLPGRRLPHVRRLRLGHSDSGRAVGLHARRGQAVLDHLEQRQPPDHLGHLEGRGVPARDRTSTRSAGSRRRRTTGVPQPGSDFWPGQFSRTHVGVTRYGYLDVMAGLRAGRVWVDHGQLVDGIDVRVAPVGSTQRGVTLGGRLTVSRNERLELRVTVTSATRPNFHGVLPRLAHLDVIRGVVTGPRLSNRDTWKAPDTRVVEQVDVHRKTGTYSAADPAGTGRAVPLRAGARAATAAATDLGTWAGRSTRPGRSSTRRTTATRGWTPGSTPTRSSSTSALIAEGLPQWSKGWSGGETGHMTATPQEGLLDPLRDGLARMIMTKVAGPDPRAERDRVHNTPGPRWFAPDRPIRRVHGDASMFAGGLAGTPAPVTPPARDGGGLGALRLPR